MASAPPGGGASWPPTTESVVVGVEARPGVARSRSGAALRAVLVRVDEALPVAPAAHAGPHPHHCAGARFGDPLAVKACWQPEPGRRLVIEPWLGANGPAPKRKPALLARLDHLGPKPWYPR